MLLTLDEENNVTVTEKFLIISDFRKYYDRYYDKKDPDLVIAYFSMLYYMYHFDSRFLWLHKDESKRLYDVRKFIHRGKDVKVSPDVRRIMELYKSLYNEEQVSSYVTMRKSLTKIRSFAEKAVLVMPKDDDPDEPSILIDSKELVMINKEIPELWKRLDTFEKDLMKYTKSAVDIYGSKNLNVYE